MTHRYLFLGPSAPGLLVPPGVTLLPPVAAGDLLALPLVEGDAVGIVDGYFHQVRAVPHKEILAVLDRGVEVLGGASMGALRAAELDALGMRGIGRVYRDYRVGTIEADDEVALLHGPPESDYRAMSEPLVVIRATLDRAVRDGECEAATAGALIDALRATPYPRRAFERFPELAEAVGVDPGELRALGEHCARHRVDVKRTDTLAVVDALVGTPAETLADTLDGALAATGPDTARPAGVRPAVPRTTYLASWEDRARQAPGVGPDRPRPGALAALRVLQLFSDAFPEARRQTVLEWIAGECARTCAAPPGLRGTSASAISHGVHTGVYPDPGHPGGSDGFGFLRSWLTGTELARLSRHEQLEAFLSRSFELEPGAAGDTFLLDGFQHAPMFSEAHGTAASCLRDSEERPLSRPCSAPALLSRDSLTARLTGIWGCTPAEADLYALDRGFPSLDAAVEAVHTYDLLLHPALRSARP
ncbi:TfuA-like protein [Streptomyces avidinii]|uniref:TfuA-like protein n=1 Tax=Streptomyces avidinii TaxID=1895 RepID=UPI0038694019|nr:TfuA-like protein [Streptomyces avidinii]